MPTQQYAYPFDPTGNAVSNRITNEIQVITPANFRDYHFIIPRFAPFFKDNFSIIYRDSQGNVTPFVEGQDYYLTHFFIGASRACAKPIYGSVTISNLNLSGSLEYSYQTIGGKWTLSESDILQILATTLLNPRSTSWENITVLPELFPVVAHEWNLDDLVGASEVVNACLSIAAAISSSGGGEGGEGGSGGSIDPAVLKMQMNLDRVPNFQLASLAEALAGIVNNRFMAPGLTKEMIDHFAADSLNAHLGNLANPHSTTAAQVGAYTVAQVEAIRNALLATITSTNQNTVTTLNAHADLTDNPHSTTAAQVGAYTTAQVDNLLALFRSNHFDNSGVALDSLRLQGLTVQNIQDAFILLTVANSNRLGNQTLAEVLVMAAAQTAANANQLQGQTVAQILTTASQQIAANSNLVQGQTVAEILAAANLQTAPNALLLGGQSAAEIITVAGQQTAPDSLKLENRSFQQVNDEIKADVLANLPPGQVPITDYAVQGIFPTIGFSTTDPTWVDILQFTKEPDGSVQKDGYYLITAGDHVNGGESNLYLLRISSKVVGVNPYTFQLQRLTHVTNDVEFGSIISAGVLSILVKTVNPTNQISVTVLTKGIGTISTIFTPYDEAPAGYTTIPIITRVFDSDRLGGRIPSDFVLVDFLTDELDTRDAEIATLTGRVTTLETQIVTLVDTMNSAFQTLNTRLIS